MTTQRVAVVVFCEVDTEHLEDAEVIAQVAVRRKLADHDDTGVWRWPANIATNAYGRHWEVRAARILEVGKAAAGNYLAIEPTSKAFR